MNHIAISVGLALSLGLGALWWENSSLKGQKASLEASIATYEAADARREEIRRREREFFQREAEARVSRSALIKQLDQLEGGNAPLDPYLSDAARLLWPESK